uniref:DUF7799 domain-containing protein n=1 Tax=Ditylenchus dipsaci TaxID=166011 RepID=A0A915ES14_9BILA
MEIIEPLREEIKQGPWKSATTISTIAVQAEPHTRIVIAMLKSIGYVELRIDEMKPKLLEIGKDLAETSHLLNSHTDLFSRLMSKQQQVEELLTRAHDLVSQQTEQDDVVVYEAMADGLSIAWRELSRQLELRGYILIDTYAFYELAQRHEQLNNHTNSLLHRALGASEASNSSQISSQPSDVAGIVRATQQAINELIGITASAVDIGSNIISQIRVVGSLADNAERAEEVVDACLTIEKVMLKMAQQWEMIDNFWNAERTKLESIVGTLEAAPSREVESSEHLQAHTNAAEAWLNAAKQTFHTMEVTPDAANQLLEEVKNQKEKLQKLNVSKHKDLSHRHAKLLKDFDGLANSLEEITQLSSKVQQFLQNADSVLNQLNQMAGELIDANAAIAGELGPLAHQKAGALIDEGEHLLSLESNEHVSQKVEVLKVRLTEVERLARERIALAKNSNQKLQAQLSALNSWLKDVAEAFLSHNGHLGDDYSSCVDFLSKHKQFAADVINKEQDVISVLSHSQELAATDRQKMAEFQKKYEQLRHILETRLELGRNFEQVQKFSKELDNSFVTVSNLLSSSNQSNFATHESIGQQIRNIIQLIHETLQQERHLGKT